jgi:hypothetical protein
MTWRQVRWTVALTAAAASSPVAFGTAVYGVYRLFAWYGTHIDQGES